MGRQRIELLGGQWRRFRKGGQRSRCEDDCDCEVACDETEPVELEDCDDVICLLGMYALVTLEFEDRDEDHNDSILNGSYVFEPQCPGWQMTEGAQAIFRRKLTAAGYAVDPGCDLDQFFLSFQATCLDGNLIVTTAFGSTAVDCQPSDGDISAVGTHPLPITLTGGVDISFSMTPNDHGEDSPNLTSAEVAFFGKPCDDCPPTSCPDGPTVDFELSNEETGYNYCDIEVAPGGCTFNVTVEAMGGVCPIVDCFWSDGNQDGCARTSADFNFGCGEFDGELTLYVVDSAGCVTKVTKEWECCQCCPPSGSFDVESDEAIENAPFQCEMPVGFCEELDDPPESGACDIVCFYKIVFNPGATTCGGTLRYLIDWDGMKLRDGSDPLICYDAGSEVRVKHNEGLDGDCHCITVTPIDTQGCSAESQYFIFLNQFFHPNVRCEDCPA